MNITLAAYKEVQLKLKITGITNPNHSQLAGIASFGVRIVEESTDRVISYFSVPSPKINPGAISEFNVVTPASGTISVGGAIGVLDISIKPADSIPEGGMITVDTTDSTFVLTANSFQIGCVVISGLDSSSSGDYPSCTASNKRLTI